MDNDPIEEFLRRVTQKRAQRQEPPQDVVEILEPEEIIEATTVGADHEKAVPRLTNRVGVAEHAAHLGEEVGLADERLAARLHKRFDHQLGSLKRTDEEAPEQGESAAGVSEETRAAALRRALHTSARIRQAVLLSEILNPAHLRG